MPRGVEPTFADLKVLNRQRWDNAKILTRWNSQAEAAAKKIMGLSARYKAVEKLTGVPWYVIAVKHLREASCNFKGVLHNGEHIIGKGIKTSLVPANRGPFNSWEEAAVDALRLKGLHKIADWSIERVLYECERFNGWGYHWKRKPSPYVWSGTTLYDRGKYVADSKYDGNHVDTQLGVAIVLKKLQAMGVPVDSARPRPKPAPVPPPPDIEPTEPPEKKGWFRTLGSWLRAAFVAGGFGGLTWLTDWQIAAIFFGFLSAVIGLVIWAAFFFWDAPEIKAWLEKQFR
jgi:lysozyme family protein